MPKVIKCCPFCGSQADMALFEGDFSVSCTNIFNCGAQGPFKKTAEDARNGWNARREQVSQSQALHIAKEALTYYAHMFAGIEVRDGGDKAAEALAAIKEAEQISLPQQ